jgi:hypothetical protein
MNETDMPDPVKNFPRMIQRGFLNKGEAERGNFWDLFHVWDSRNL